MTSSISNVNLIGSETYLKDCAVAERWDLKVSENQAEKIAGGCQDGYINIRHVQGKFVEYEGKEVWLGDNLGRIAEGLSRGRIQLQPSESTKELSEKRSWTSIPTSEAKGWKEIYIAYVYSGDVPSLKLVEQAENNPKRVLFEAGTIHQGQYIGVSEDLKVVVGDHLEEVVEYIQGGQVKEIPAVT